MDETVDPAVSQLYTRTSADLLQQPALVIAFHSDLTRVGDYLLLDPASQTPTAIGRATPSFSGASLEDPCVSRDQLRVRWDDTTQQFFVAKNPAARREVRVVHPHEQVIGDTEVALSEESLVAIGDRILFLLCRVRPFTAGVESLIGFSAAMQNVRETVRRLADMPSSVLITGEPGVGKEVVAKALHNAGSRRGRPFLAVNCASLPESLIEHELFGHTRGAFTGANAPKPGLFRAANTGSLLLDELGEIPLDLQAKMLRVLQEKKVRPVGGTDELPIDTRILAATNRDLLAAVAAGSFRSDLYSRIEAPFIDIPPLRERIVDVPILFAYFMVQQAKQSPIARRMLRKADEHTPLVQMEKVLRLLDHSWPRNVRELQKLVEASLIQSADSKRFCLPEWRWKGAQEPQASTTTPAATTASVPLHRVDPSSIDETTLLETLEQYQFVARKVANHFGISRTTLDKLMRERNIPRPFRSVCRRNHQSAWHHRR